MGANGGLNAREAVDEMRQELGIFGDPFLNGFPDDDDTRQQVALLPALNKAYFEGVWLGIKQCELHVDLEADVDGNYYQRFKIPNTFTLVSLVTLVDNDYNREYALEPNSLTRIVTERPQILNSPPRRPTEVYWGGGFMGFNYRPDKAYTLKILADVMPSPLVNEDDEITRLETFFHRGIVMGAVSFTGRKMMGMQGYTQFHAMRQKSWDAEWAEWKERIKKTYASRSKDSRFAAYLDEYRMYQGGIVYSKR